VRSLAPALHWIAGLLLLVALPPTVLPAQDVRELGIQALGTFADVAFWGGGFYGGRRWGEHLRTALTGSFGVERGELAARGELLGHFLISGRSARHPTVYGLAGLAGVAGPEGHGWLVAGLGLETQPGAGSGWAIELGVGGGVRVAAAYRWRWFPRGWAPGD